MKKNLWHGFVAVFVMGVLSVATMKDAHAIPLSNAACGAVTSKFGPRIAPKRGASTNHPGVDYGCNGAALSANIPGSMWCKSRYDGNGAGNRCHIEISCVKFSYFHMADGGGFKAGGRKVEHHQPIGVSGNTGNSTGPHLHFEFRVAGTPVDPVHMFANYSTVEQICTPDAVRDALNERNRVMSQPVSDDDAVNPNHDFDVDECTNAELADN